jgi:dTDP-4-amino-4,6-dideoxygalactose transaminase
MKIPPVKTPFAEADIERLSERFKETLRSGHIAMGGNAAAFETAFASWLGTPYAVATGSGTQALELVFRALDLEGASVCVPAVTFMASCFAPLAAGARIVLVDCDPATFQMDPDDLARRIRTDTRAVLLVHLGGIISPAWERIRDISSDAGAVLIEDAAHAHGSEAGDLKAGTLGLASAFSFFATKVLPAGEGGMVATADEELAKRMLAVRQHGQTRPGSNVHEFFGLNYRPSEFHSLLGLDVLERAEEIISGRRKAAAVYDSLLSSTRFKTLAVPTGQRSSYYKYIVLLPQGISRGSFKERLYGRHGYGLAGEVYSLSLDRQPFWEKNPDSLASPLEALPGARKACESHICLPIWPGIDPADQRLLVEAMEETAKTF